MDIEDAAVTCANNVSLYNEPVENAEYEIWAKGQATSADVGQRRRDPVGGGEGPQIRNVFRRLVCKHQQIGEIATLQQVLQNAAANPVISE